MSKPKKLRDIEKRANKLFRKLDKKQVKKSKKTSVFSTSGKNPGQVSHLVAKLAYINPDMPYNDWLNICFAIHHEFQGSDDGLKLFIKWSRGDFRKDKAEKFDEEYCIEKYESTDGNSEQVRTGKTIDHYYRISRPGINSADSKKGKPFFQHVKKLKNLPSVPWLIPQVLPMNSMSLFFGESGSYKTFLVASICFCVAAGIPWFGKKVKRQVVFMIIGEGHHGIYKRIQALTSSRNLKNGFEPP